MDGLDPKRKHEAELHAESMHDDLLEYYESSYLKATHGHLNFSLVDRQRTESILNELKFNASGLITKEYQSKLGKLLGASHLLFVNPNIQYKPNEFEYSALLKLLKVENGEILGVSKINDTLPYQNTNYEIYKAQLKDIDFLYDEFIKSYKDVINKIERNEFSEATETLTVTSIPSLKSYLKSLKNISPKAADIKSAHFLYIESMQVMLEAIEIQKSFFVNRELKLKYESDEKIAISIQKLREYGERMKQLQKE